MKKARRERVIALKAELVTTLPPLISKVKDLEVARVAIVDRKRPPPQLR